MLSYAHDTAVPVARSRGEIDALLRQWGCDSIQWTDQFREGVAELRFAWTWNGTTYRARLAVRMPADAALRKHGDTATQLAKRRDQRWRSLHRVLLLTIKAQLNAVESGLLTAIEVFLPHLEGADGRTVAELAAESLPRLLGDRG